MYMQFSVLISVYIKDNPEYLKEALDSVINQTVMPSEIVLIKDGELTDKLEEVISKFVDCNPNLFKVIGYEVNKGLGYALKIGVEECSYDIIARMDSDDICREDRFEKQLSVLKHDASIGIVGSNISEFEVNKDNIVSIRKVPSDNESIIRYAKKRNPFNHMSVMYRKKEVLDAGNYKEFLWNEDYYLWVRMILNKCQCANIEENLVYARVGKAMFERRGGIKYAINDIKLQREFKRLNFINYYQVILNTILRNIVRLMPNNMRRMIYIKILRT